MLITSNHHRSMGRSVPPVIQKVNDVNETSKKANGRNGKGREGPTWPPARIPINAKNYYSRPRRNLRAEENVGLGVHGHTGVLNAGRGTAPLTRESRMHALWQGDRWGQQRRSQKHAIVLETRMHVPAIGVQQRRGKPPNLQIEARGRSHERTWCAAAESCKREVCWQEITDNE